MNIWRLSPIAAALLTGVCQLASAATANVYYYQPYKSWSSVFIHHNGSGSWTTPPGTQMSSACTGWTKQSIETAAASFSAVFTNGAGAWDNLNNQAGANYTLTAGSHQVKNGQILANAGDPCDTSPKSATVYYKSGWAPAYIHYQIGSGAWTTVPGSAMEAACTGWHKKTIALGSSTSLNAAFNNGSGQWDSRGGSNYQLGINDSKVEAGVASAGNPCPVDTTPPTAPSALRKGVVSQTSVALSWTASTDNVGVTAYDIKNNDVKIGSSATPAFTVTGLTANTAYRFTVVARDAAGNVSDASAALPVTTLQRDTIKPTVPTGLRKGTVTSTTVALAWTASTDNVAVKGYGILRDGNLVGTTTRTT